MILTFMILMISGSNGFRTTLPNDVMARVFKLFAQLALHHDDLHA